MGISNFERFLKVVQRRYRDVKKFTPPDDVHNLLIDGNGAVYSALRDVIKSDPGFQSITPHAFERLVIEKTIQIFEKFRVLHKPSEVFAILFDGVVPDAKADQQRDRRYTRAMEKSDAISKGSDRTSEENELLAPFDTAVISPGTPFMEKLMRSVKDYLASYDVVQGSKDVPRAERMYFSSDLVPGEGEHKIVDLIRRGFIRKTGNHVIIGGDSDLIVLMAAQNIENAYVYREQMNYWVNINLVKYYLNDVWGDSVYDFLLVIAFMGNDFLPSPIAFMKSADPTYNAVDEIVAAYKETVADDEYIVDSNGEIDLDRFALFIRNLRKREIKMIEKVAPNRQNSPIFAKNLSYVSHNYVSKSEADLSGVKFNSQSNYQDFVMQWREQEIALNKNIPGISKKDPLDVGLDAGTAFILGVYWTFSYYTTGKASYSWVYPYVYAPMIIDMDFLDDLEDSAFRVDLLKRIKSVVSPTNPAPLMTIPQLLFSIIPENTTYGAPSAIMPLIISEAERRNFVPTIDYYGLDSADSHVFTTNLPIVSRKYNSNRGEWVLVGVPDDVNDALDRLASGYATEQTVFTERKESAINLAVSERLRFDEEVSRFKLQWKGENRTATESSSSYTPSRSSSQASSSNASSSSPKAASSAPRAAATGTTVRRTVRVAGVPKGVKK